MFLKTPKFWYKKPPINRALRCCLKPFSEIYGFFAARNLRKKYKYKALRARVIAVGGLTAGGSGKTPLVASICDIFRDYGHRAAVLSRGFGRDSNSNSNSNQVLLVDPFRHTFKEVGDEPLILARHADVYVGKNRMKSAEKAEGMGHDIIIMDDGITQRDLQPDVRIVVIDSSQGLGNGELLPLGPNRINFDMLKDDTREKKCIDAVVIIKSHKLEDISHIIEKIPEGMAVFIGYLKGDFSRIKTQDWNHPEKQKLNAILDQRHRSNNKKKEHKKKMVVREAISVESELYSVATKLPEDPAAPIERFLAFCGIGYPQKFFNTLHKKIKVVKELEFPDHYPFSDDEIVDLLDEARLLDANLITTEKDLCRISKQYHNFISVVPVRVAWENPEEIAKFLGIDFAIPIKNEERCIKLFMASDHAGFLLKSYLKEEIPKYFDNIQIVDLGTNSEESCDYPLYANKLAECMTSEIENYAKDRSPNFIKGVLICGTGIGMSIAANRHPHIRAALCNSEALASLARRHNDANVLVFGARFFGTYEIAMRCLACFLDTEFEGGRHERRVKMLYNSCITFDKENYI